MSLHSKDWMKIGLGAALLALTGGLAGVGIPGLFGAGADAGAAGAAGATGAGASTAGSALAADMAAEGAGAAGAAGAGAAAAAPAASSGLGQSLMSLGAGATKDAAKAGITTAMLQAMTPQQKATLYGQPLQMMQQPDPMSMFPKQ